MSGACESVRDKTTRYKNQSVCYNTMNFMSSRLLFGTQDHRTFPGTLRISTAIVSEDRHASEMPARTSETVCNEHLE